MSEKAILPATAAMASATGYGARWKHYRGGRGEKRWRKWVCWELQAWVTHLQCSSSVVHYGIGMSHRGTMDATPEAARRKIEDMCLNSTEPLTKL